MQSVHTLLKLAQLRWTGHVTRMPGGCQRKFSVESYRKESAHKVAKRNATKTSLKPHLRSSIFQLSPGNRLHRIEQSGVVSSTMEPYNLNQRESVKLKESIKNGKQEPMIHHQTWHSPNSHALFATDSLELKLAYTAINEHTITQEHLISGFKMVFLSTERRTITIASVPDNCLILTGYGHSVKQKQLLGNYRDLPCVHYVVYPSSEEPLIAGMFL